MSEFLFEFTPVARREVMEASRWYKSKAPDLSLRFNQQVTDELEKICRYPLRNPEAQPGFGAHGCQIFLTTCTIGLRVIFCM